MTLYSRLLIPSPGITHTHARAQGLVLALHCCSFSNFHNLVLSLQCVCRMATAVAELVAQYVFSPEYKRHDQWFYNLPEKDRGIMMNAIEGKDLNWYMRRESPICGYLDDFRIEYGHNFRHRDRMYVVVAPDRLEYLFSIQAENQKRLLL
jgi:hypothetical protein